MKVSRVMKKAIAVEDNIKLRDAVKIMSGKNIGSLVVMRKDKIVGITTERDILKNVSSLDSKISGIMSRNVICIDKEGNLDTAASLMAEHKIKRIPVIDKGKLAGIITATDLIASSDDLNENFFFE